MEGKFNRRLDFSTAGCAAGLRRTAIDETAPFCYDRQRTKTGKRGIAVDLTEGGITGRLLRFALPLMVGNLLQQLYNVADTLIVGRFLGADALAAVGSAYSLMTFLTSILLGLCMGSSAYFSIQFGRRDDDRLKNGFFLSFVLIGAAALVLTAAAFALLDWIIGALQAPADVAPLMRDYLYCIFFGILATFLYNYFANLLRAVGNSVVPLLFLAVSAVLNIVLDLVFVLVCRWGVTGAAAATVIAQYVSGAGLLIYYFVFWRRFRKENIRLPFLCGENIEISNVDEDHDVRSYDFHSICGKVEHCVFSSYYFHGIINERLVTMCLNWAAWLIIIVLIGNSIMATR